MNPCNFNSTKQIYTSSIIISIYHAPSVLLLVVSLFMHAYPLIFSLVRDTELEELDNLSEVDNKSKGLLCKSLTIY